MRAVPPLLSGAYNMHSEQEISEYVLKRSRPLIVALIERLHRLEPLRHLHWSVTCLLVALSVYIPAVWWLFFGLRNGPQPHAFYWFGATLFTFLSFNFLTGTMICYRLAGRSLPQVIHALEIGGHTLKDLPGWSRRFSASVEVSVMLAFGSIVAIMAFLVYVTWQIGDPLSVAGGCLSACLIGLIIGDFLHFFVNLLSITPVLLSGKIKMHTMRLAETNGLSTLIGFTTQFMGIGAIVGALMLSPLTLFIVVFTDYQINISYLSIAFTVLGIWIALLIPLQQVFSAVSRVIRTQKAQTLSELQPLLDQKYRDLTTGTPNASVEELHTLVALCDSVRSSPNLPIEFASISRVLIGFALPALPSIIQRLLH